MKTLVAALAFVPYIIGAMDPDVSNNSPESLSASPLSSPRPYNSPRRSSSCTLLIATQKTRMGEGSDSPERCSPRGRRRYSDIENRLKELQEQKAVIQSDDKQIIKDIEFEMRALEIEKKDFEIAQQKTQELLTRCNSDEMKIIKKSHSRTIIKQRKSVKDLFAPIAEVNEDSQQ